MSPPCVLVLTAWATALLAAAPDGPAVQEGATAKGLPPEVAKPATDHAEQAPASPEQRLTEETFVRLMGDGNFTRHNRLDRVAHWSRAVRDADAYLSESREQRIAAFRAHTERMERLEEKARGRSGPRLQDRAAESARFYREQAERELRLVSSQSFGAGVLGTGVGQRRAPLSGDATLTHSVRTYRAMQTGEAQDSLGASGVADDARERRDRLRVEIAAEAARVASERPAPPARRALTRLDEPLPMNFSVETPLEDVLNYVKHELSQGPEDRRVPLYIDPVGLLDVDIRLDAPVVMDLEGVPLKTSLRLVLKQVGLAYCVRDGVVVISSPEGVVQELREARLEPQAEGR